MSIISTILQDPLNYSAHNDLIAELRRYRILQFQNPVKPQHRREGRELERTIRDLAESDGVEHLAFLTLTVRDDLSPAAALEQLDAVNRILKQAFPLGMIRLLDLSGANGKSHFHCVVRMDFDAKEGFDWDNYHELRRLNTKWAALPESERRRASELAQAVTSNQNLKTLTEQLQRKLHKHGFGRIELTPFRQDPKVVARYMLKGFFSSIRLKRRPKGCRLLGYSRAIPRYRENRDTPFRALIRRKHGAIFAAIGVPKEEMTARFGRYWCGCLMPLIDEFDLIYGPEPLSWRPDVVRQKVLQALLPKDTRYFQILHEQQKLGNAQPDR